MADRLIRHLVSVDSTNEYMLRLAAAGAPGGTVVTAGEQTAGRGRRGRTWHSPEGGLYLSYLVRDVAAMPRPALLTLAAGVAVVRAIARATGLQVQLKWPNDVVTAADKPQKLAGILAEGSSTGSQLEFVVIGAGVNIAPVAVPPALGAAASALESELGRAVDREALRDALIDEIDTVVAELRAGRDGALRHVWIAHAPGARGARVSWQSAAGAREGITQGIDDEGALIVRTATGVERLVAGDVRWA